MPDAALPITSMAPAPDVVFGPAVPPARASEPASVELSYVPTVSHFVPYDGTHDVRITTDPVTVPMQRLTGAAGCSALHPCGCAGDGLVFVVVVSGAASRRRRSR